MSGDKQYGGLDYFKIIAALLVVTIHTSPLSVIGNEANYLLTRVFARIAVPFFLMVTGYFVLPQYLFDKSTDYHALLRFVKKIVLLYGIAIAIYLPIGIYARHYTNINMLWIVKILFFDGIFYHLWYFPASVIGISLIFFLSKKLSPKWVLGITLILYCLGLFGDSYYGAISKVPVILSIYDAGFNLFSYTRNGFFYTPVFLVMGAWARQPIHNFSRKVSAICFSISMLMMAGEGMVLHHLGWQRHDSMYFSLLPCMIFLYQLVLSWNICPKPDFRTISTLIYLIHPLFIVVIRGIAKVMKITNELVNNSIIYYLIVCVMSMIFSIAIVKLPVSKGNRSFYKGRAWIELSRKNLKHNADVLKSLLPDSCKLMPAVKANAYGHGAVLIARELNAIGVKAFCVATVLEGVELRENNIRGEILILGYTHQTQFSLLHHYHLIQTVIDYSYAHILNMYGKHIKVHIKIDTGMHRLGERSERIKEIVKIFSVRIFKLKVYLLTYALLIAIALRIELLQVCKPNLFTM